MGHAGCFTFQVVVQRHLSAVDGNGGKVIGKPSQGFVDRFIAYLIVHPGQRCLHHGPLIGDSAVQVDDHGVAACGRLVYVEGEDGVIP